jgi:hypothetical protein
MMLFDATYLEDVRLCQPACSRSAIALYRYNCTGLCHPDTDMHALHGDPQCSEDVRVLVEDSALSEEAQPGLEVWTQVAEPRETLPFMSPPWKQHSIFQLMQQAIETP